MIKRGRRRRGSLLLTGLSWLMLLYALVPLAWLVINSTKTQESLLDSFGLWFHGREHGIQARSVICAFESAGLRLIARDDGWGGGLYLLVFERPAGA